MKIRECSQETRVHHHKGRERSLCEICHSATACTKLWTIKVTPEVYRTSSTLNTNKYNSDQLYTTNTTLLHVACAIVKYAII